jgi:hypothetical protein
MSSYIREIVKVIKNRSGKRKRIRIKKKRG